MGWWRIRNVESGTIDWSHKCSTNSQLVNAIPGEEAEDALYNGDQPADLMGPVLDEINEEYREAWGRPVKREELTAVFNFCSGPLFDDNGYWVGEEESQIKEETMTKQKEPKPIQQIEQMRILYETTHAAFHIMRTLYDNDRLDDIEVTWRLGAVVGMLGMMQSEIETVIILMEDGYYDKEEEDVSEENVVPG